MRKYGDNLFRIGEVTKILGITRKTLLVYEEMGLLELLCCIPVNCDQDGVDYIEFAETPALCIYYRGDYEGIADVIRKLRQYVIDHNIQTAGSFRSIYLEGPPSRGENSADYITEVAVPIILT